jgi:hypothetical protein
MALAIPLLQERRNKFMKKSLSILSMGLLTAALLIPSGSGHAADWRQRQELRQDWQRLEQLRQQRNREIREGDRRGIREYNEKIRDAQREIYRDRRNLNRQAYNRRYRHFDHERHHHDHEFE